MSNSLRVLVVEDVQIARKMSLIVLEEVGCLVSTATSGYESLSLIEENFYDLIFMDVGLPDIDGLTLTQKIKCFQESSGKKSRIIALTAHCDEEFRQTCLENGMDDYLVKPLTTKICEEVLSKHFDTRALG